MKIAILHPWFLMKGGGERVIDVMAQMFPTADFFALFVDPLQLSEILASKRVVASKLNRFPWSARLHRHLMPLYPWAVESFDLSAYDLVISSCGPAMMGAAIKQDAIHICYCHTPQRLWWDLYAEHQNQLAGIAQALFVFGCTYNRIFEFNAMQRVDHLAVNSRFIEQRVAKYFRLPSTIIYPPVNVSCGFIAESHEDYYLYVGRLERQKRVDLLISACNRLKRKLLISGAGREEKALRGLAGPTVRFLGRVPDAEVGILFSRCRAFLFAAVEDFGIAPVEAQSYGRPVIAYGYGGALETVRVGDPEGREDTGVFFKTQEVESMMEAIESFESREMDFSPLSIQRHAAMFDTPNFVQSFGGYINAALRSHGMPEAYIPTELR